MPTTVAGGSGAKGDQQQGGDQYQATIPAQIGKRPAPGREEDDPHCGIPGPSTEQALALAKGPELAAARALPPDATSDILLGRVCSVLLRACRVKGSQQTSSATCKAPAMNKHNPMDQIALEPYLHRHLMAAMMLVSFPP